MTALRVLGLSNVDFRKCVKGKVPQLSMSVLILLLLMLSFYLWTGLAVPAYEKTCSLKKEYEGAKHVTGSTATGPKVSPTRDPWLWLAKMAFILQTTLWIDSTLDPYAKWIHLLSKLLVRLCQASLFNQRLSKTKHSENLLSTTLHHSTSGHQTNNHSHTYTMTFTRKPIFWGSKTFI